jgi:hypothetical protein
VIIPSPSSGTDTDTTAFSPLSLDSLSHSRKSPSDGSLCIFNSFFGLASADTQSTISTSNEPRDLPQHYSDMTTPFIAGNKRQTSEQRQSQREFDQNVHDLKDTAFKLATILFDSAKKGLVALKEFETASQCASAVNGMLGFNLVACDSIARAVESGKVGVARTRRGPAGRIADEDVADLADMCFTLCSIEQNNTEERTKRPDLASLVGQIVNGKLKEEGENEIEDLIGFYGRIQQMNSPRQGVMIPNTREARRVMWLTHQNLVKHYQSFENMLVEKGFARPAIDEAEQKEKGYVVLHEGQESRICNFDEMRFSLTGDENPGGRPAAVYTNPFVHEAGEPTDKGDGALTLILL